MSETIYGKIKEVIDEYESTTLDCNPVFAPRIKDIIELVDLYWVNRYRDGDFDSTGFKKAFYNIVINPTEIASKMIDLDTKDVLVVAEDGQSYYPAWLFGKELKIWMKDKKNQDGQTFGQLLNQMVYHYPKYGHLIVKKAKDTVHIVPIQNIFGDPEAKNFLSSEVLVEKHEYTPEQLRQQRGWKNVEDIITSFEKDGKIVVYEKHEEVKRGDNYVIIPEKGKDDDILHKGKIDRKDLYKELKWEDIPGRVLGRGHPEKLFEAQIAKNQNENLLRSGYRWTSKKLWQTRDDNVAKNLITELEDGDVLTINSEITPIAMEERNLGAIREGDNKWDKNISDLTFSYEPLSGQRPPSGTPLGTSILQTRMAGQYYDLKREDLGMFIKDILFDWVIPEFKKQKKSAHNLMLGEFDEDELQVLRGLIMTNKNNEVFINSIKKNGAIPTMKEMDILKGIVSKQVKASKELEIPENTYQDIKFKIDIIITQEQTDTTNKVNTLLQMYQTEENPKDKKKMRREIMNLLGISPVRYGQEEETTLEEMMQNVLPPRGSPPRVSMPTGQPQQVVGSKTL